MPLDSDYDTDDSPPTTRRRRIKRKPTINKKAVKSNINPDRKFIPLTPELKAQGYKGGDWVCTQKSVLDITPGYHVHRDVSPDREYPKEPSDPGRMVLRTKTKKKKPARQQQQQQQQEPTSPAKEQDDDEKKPTIFVDLPDGQRITIPYDPTATSDDWKAAIHQQQQPNLPVDDQYLTFRGKELPEETLAERLGIIPDSVLQVQLQHFPVTVHTWDDQTLTMMVDRQDTLGEVKLDLQQATGLPVDDQILSLFQDYDNMPRGGGGVVVLDNHHVRELVGDHLTAQDHGIVPKTHLYLEPKYITITVHTWDDQLVLLENVDPHDTLGDLRKQLAAPTNVAPSNQRITKLRNPHNNTMTTDDGDDELVGDRNTLENHGIENGTHLYLEPKLLHLVVELPDGNEMEVETRPQDTAQQIKQQIYDLDKNLPVEEQVLKLPNDGGGYAELPPDQTMKDMGMRDGDRVLCESLKPKSVTVTVHTWDDQHLLLEDIDPHDSLGNLRKQLQTPTGVEVNNQRLTKLLDYTNNPDSTDGEELVGDRKSLVNHGIQDGAHLYLEPKLWHVVVEMPDGGGEELLQVRPEDTVRELKEQLRDQTNMDVSKQILTFPRNGKELPNDKTITDMGIRNGDHVRCERAKIPIVVQTEDEKLQIPLRVDPTTTTIEDIKRLCAKPSGMDVSKQILKPNKNTTEEFKDGSVTVEDCGIQANDTVWLSQKHPPSKENHHKHPHKKEHCEKTKPMPKPKGGKNGTHHGSEGPHLGEGGFSIKETKWYGDWEFELVPPTHNYVSKTMQGTGEE